MLAGRAHIHPLPTAVLRGVLVCVLPWIKVRSGKLVCIWSLQLELLAILACQEGVRRVTYDGKHQPSVDTAALYAALCGNEVEVVPYAQH